MNGRREANRRLRKSERKSVVQGNIVTETFPGGSGAKVRGPVPISSWTSSGGRYYYDLQHNLNRRAIFVTLLDEHTGDQFWPDQVQPQSTGVSRIWVSNNYAADRISLFFF